MTEPTPPPEERLPDHARARIRADLLVATEERRRPGGLRRWVVPAAAASVVLAAGLVGWAVSAGIDDRGADSGLAGAPTVSESATESAVPTPTPAETSAPVPTLSEGATAFPQSAPPSSRPPDEESCAAELQEVLRGASEVATFPDDIGTTSFWVKGDRFTICDVRAGTTTVNRPLPLVPNLDDIATWRMSSQYAGTPDGDRTVRVAGGLVPEGALAFDVVYTFPDGHTETAATTTDSAGRTWWRMLYAYDDGGGNETEKPPIGVAVTLSGSRRGFALAWGIDTCAQANHGC